MILTTTQNVEGREVQDYRGIVVGEAITGANFVKDIFASVRDLVGGRSGAYENELNNARKIAFKELEEDAMAIGADAVIGIDIDYEVLGQSNGMFLVSISGTAVTFK
ncbi:heavy metal-binding domain-containing protein [Opacimonas viscosa]|uniref:UPF0145 protein NLF92_01565 n=1 Tax=Opacimonas viscosa TaxID=2961944 RepID=A0AA41WW29_9ALTE|nr:heavy metal-binding domain-containing protein [Opacimonas viscosa]MCP3427632.1 heavy metal-binding domain-containing protein [Opacimonas viscosa]